MGWWCERKAKREERGQESEGAWQVQERPQWLNERQLSDWNPHLSRVLMSLPRVFSCRKLSSRIRTLRR
jgi:hypothetical protein